MIVKLTFMLVSFPSLISTTRQLDVNMLNDELLAC